MSFVNRASTIISAARAGEDSNRVYARRLDDSINANTREFNATAERLVKARWNSDTTGAMRAEHQLNNLGRHLDDLQYRRRYVPGGW